MTTTNQLSRTLRYLLQRLLQRSRPPDAPPVRRAIRAFEPGQVILLVEAPDAIEPRRLQEALRQDPLLAEQEVLRNALNRPPRRVIAFPPLREQPGFALVFLDVPVDDATLIRLCDTLIERLLKPTPPGDGLTIRAVSPNWLMSCAHHLGALGGPGTQPVPDAPPPDAWRFKLPAGIAQVTAQATAEVEVAILDTAPCAHELERAYHLWHATHPLVARLLGPGSPLQITHASLAELIAMGGYDLARHRYPMADHGLFVAGIIHTIAPRARLHLIEVLNQFGVGTLESVASGLQRLAERTASSPLVINCSLVLNMPLPEHLPTLEQRHLHWPSLTTGALEVMSRVLERLCQRLRLEEALIVAAAGNDAEPGLVPRARFPAAFESVIGVGALRRNQAPAEYSNLSDTPVRAGYATFGGAPLGGGTPPSEGVLGMYVGPFPGGAPNTTGWARWSGTSFAAPVISGTLAALLASGQPPATALATLEHALSGANAIGRIFPASQA